MNWYKKAQYSVEEEETHPLPALSDRGDHIVETVDAIEMDNGRIICEQCGRQFVIGNLETHQNLAPHAREKGWSIAGPSSVCPKCKENLSPEELLMREIVR